MESEMIPHCMHKEHAFITAKRRHVFYKLFEKTFEINLQFMDLKMRISVCSANLNCLMFAHTKIIQETYHVECKARANKNPSLIQNLSNLFFH